MKLKVEMYTDEGKYIESFQLINLSGLEDSWEAMIDEAYAEKLDVADKKSEFVQNMLKNGFSLVFEQEPVFYEHHESPEIAAAFLEQVRNMPACKCRKCTGKDEMESIYTEEGLDALQD